MNKEFNYLTFSKINDEIKWYSRLCINVCCRRHTLQKVGILCMPFKSSHIYKSGNRHLSKLHKVVFKKVLFSCNLWYRKLSLFVGKIFTGVFEVSIFKVMEKNDVSRKWFCVNDFCGYSSYNKILLFRFLLL